MVSIKIKDDLIADWKTEKKKINPYDADKKATHIVEKLIENDIIKMRNENDK